MIIGGYTLSPESGRLQIPLVYQPTMENIASIVCEYSKLDGVASLSITPTPESGPYEIKLHADSGNYLLMLNQYLEDGEHVVRTLNNVSTGGKIIEILGDYYQSNLITRDIRIAVSCFQEFLNYGDVSLSVLNI